MSFDAVEHRLSFDAGGMDPDGRERDMMLLRHTDERLKESERELRLGGVCAAWGRKENEVFDALFLLENAVLGEQGGDTLVVCWRGYCWDSLRGVKKSSVDL